MSFKKTKKFYSVLTIGLVGVLLPVITKAALPDPLHGQDVGAVITRIVSAVQGVIGAASAIMFVVGGILYMTAVGDPKKLSQAKTALLYAVIGTVITVAAGGLVQLIQSTLS